MHLLKLAFMMMFLVPLLMVLTFLIRFARGQVAVLLFLGTSTTTAFLFDTTCPAPLPCSCSWDQIMCSYKQLTQVPSFLVQQAAQFISLRISFIGNQITNLPANAFQNLSSVNASYVTLDCQSNHIDTIDIHAFDGIQNTLINLNLENNNLTDLPPAFKGLTFLQQLNLKKNPLKKLDASVMSAIGKIIERFDISVDYFPVFPTEIRYLNKLTNLRVDKVNFPTLNNNVFSGFETSLTLLEISYSRLESIPPAVCRLKNLKYFYFTHSPALQKYNSSVFDICRNNLTSLTDMDLSNNSLTIFPRISTFSPSLKKLYLKYNSFQSIENRSLASVTTLTYLDLSYNSFTRIPIALNMLTNLQILYFFSNKVSSIGDQDFLSLSRLQELHLDGNPISHISPICFRNNPLLNNIHLDQSSLDHIPEAVLRLRHLQFLGLGGRQILCSCTEMSNLKSWNFSAISISGYCTAGEAIKTYLANSLPQCP